jgi:hypothetical protein
MTVTSALYLQDGWDDLEDPNLATALVIAELIRIVEESGGSMNRLESDVMELRLATGEVFHLDQETITRVA